MNTRVARPLPYILLGLVFIFLIGFGVHLVFTSNLTDDFNGVFRGIIIFTLLVSGIIGLYLLFHKYFKMNEKEVDLKKYDLKEKFARHFDIIQYKCLKFDDIEKIKELIHKIRKKEQITGLCPLPDNINNKILNNIEGNIKEIKKEIVKVNDIIKELNKIKEIKKINELLEKVKKECGEKCETIIERINGQISDYYNLLDEIRNNNVKNIKDNIDEIKNGLGEVYEIIENLSELKYKDFEKYIKKIK